MLEEQRKAGGEAAGHREPTARVLEAVADVAHELLREGLVAAEECRRPEGVLHGVREVLRAESHTDNT